jgi:hypothetical protein
VSHNPGPGTYSLSSTLDHKGPTFKGRHNSKDGELTPGPGAYEHKSGLSKGGFTLKGRTNTSIQNHNPGPGAYSSKTYIGEDKKFSMSGKAKDLSIRSMLHFIC